MVNSSSQILQMEDTREGMRMNKGVNDGAKIG